MILLTIYKKGFLVKKRGKTRGKRGQSVKNPLIRGMPFKKGAMWATLCGSYVCPLCLEIIAAAGKIPPSSSSSEQTISKLGPTDIKALKWPGKYIRH